MRNTRRISYEYYCRRCGCRLDPGEGRLCDECRAEMDAPAQLDPAAAVALRNTGGRKVLLNV